MSNRSGGYKVFGSVRDIVLGIIAIPQLLYFFLGYLSHRYFEYSIFENLHFWICIATTILASFSIVRLGVIYIEPLKLKYMECRKKGSFRDKISFLLSNKYFWIQFSSIALVYIVLPLEWVSSVYTHHYFEFIDIPNKLTVLCILLPVIFIIVVVGHLSAYNFWNTNTHDDVYTKHEYEKKWALLVCGYLGGAIAVFMGIPITYSFAPLFLELLTIDVIVVVLIIVFISILSKVFRAYWKRKVCIKNLYKICKERGYAISKINKPIQSIFRPQANESFRVVVNSKSYSCLFVGGVNKYTPLTIYSNGTVMFSYIVRFLRFECFRFTSTYPIDYETDDRKIMILSPTPKIVYTPRQGKLIRCDNGEEIGKWKIYTATAFLRALELDVLERS